MASEEHCIHCFDVLSSHFTHGVVPPAAFPTDLQYPLFVTWNKRGPQGGADLRGCIGVLASYVCDARASRALTRAPLPDVGRMPQAAAALFAQGLRTHLRSEGHALRPYRGAGAAVPHVYATHAPLPPPPCLRSQQCLLPTLGRSGDGVRAGTVSLLTNFEVAADLDDWEIGTHGVWIDFVDLQNKARNAVYLPDVIPEQGMPQAPACGQPSFAVSQPFTEREHFWTLPFTLRCACRDRPSCVAGWTKKETIKSLVRKSGCNAQVTQELRDRISLTRCAAIRPSSTHGGRSPPSETHSLGARMLQVPKHQAYHQL